ncbi:hypothetical protein ACI65C_011979 [Semiaphis heraclei]
MNSRLDSTVTAPSSPTHYPTHPNHNPDVLDIAIIKASCLGYHLINLPNMESKPLLLPPLSTENQINPAIQIITDIISENVKSNSIHLAKDKKPSHQNPTQSSNSIISDLLHSNREEEWSNFLGSIEPSAQGWSKIYKLNRQLLRKSLPTNPLNDELGNLHYNSEAKANIFAICMENQFSVLPNTSWIDEEKYGTLIASFPTKAHQDRT